MFPGPKITVGIPVAWEKSPASQVAGKIEKEAVPAAEAMEFFNKETAGLFSEV